ncbi:MAG: hypothetical protein RLY78_2609 [Pseudomonadota bacterium]|jgi:LysR family nitrogen assimilation transcriptional regulator|uniref:LysR family transcriptional regulator n=1 Tax=Pseudaquabacterium rugosum TaxID=2984194 RepID=A0ABU9BDV7_9BURK
MNLRQLEYFVHVAELGSFSKAALVLDIAQPALSRQVRALEVDLRETLLRRNGRGVTLTEAGQRLYAHGQAILQAVREAEADLGASRDEPVGRITVGLPPSLGRQLTLPLIETFARRCPRARLAVVEGLSSHIIEWLTSGRVDLGLLYSPEAQPALQITPLSEEALCLVSPMPAGAGASSGPQPGPGMGVALADLPRYALIAPERGHVIRRLLETQAMLAGITLQVAWEVSSVAAIVDLVAAGHGHAVLHASAVAASGRADQLQVRPVVQPRLPTVLCLAQSATRRGGALQQQTARLLAELARALPQGTAAQSIPG